MEQYVNKSALAAEIEKRIKKYASIDVCHNEHLEALYGAKCKALTEILSFLDTLEWKEADFERELGRYVSEGIHRFFPGVENDYCTMDSVVWQDYVIETAKHFYELGMQAKEGNTLAKAKGFLVRDKDDYTAIYSTKPERGKTEWVDGNHPRNANESSCLFTMDAYLLPNVEFDDEPVEVEVTITKKGE